VSFNKKNSLINWEIIFADVVEKVVPENTSKIAWLGTNDGSPINV
jgi:hypothetical protein